MHIETVSEVTKELHQALQELIPQLGIHKVPPSMQELGDLIESQSSRLLVARDPDENGPIVGMLCLTVYPVPTGLRSIIEDMVVDRDSRRKGIGQGLVQHAIKLAREAGAGNVSLSSNPAREAANLLYQSMGFQLRQTNPYIYKLK
jgi:ribosomal protein S18 acetylase RimI-like enzyme